jgi:hypothetical protein
LLKIKKGIIYVSNERIDRQLEECNWNYSWISNEGPIGALL